MGRHSKKTHTIRSLVAISAATSVPAILAVPAMASTGTLGAIEQCESGGNPTAQNPHSSASGAFQFLDSTWNRFKGYARAKDAPYSVQLEKARQTPLSAWNASKHCWGGQTGSYSHSEPKVHHKAKHRAPEVHKAPRTHEAPKLHKIPAPEHYYPTHRVGGVYHVVSGDTLSEIAEDHGTSWPKVYANNRSVISDPDVIFPGQRLAL